MAKVHIEGSDLVVDVEGLDRVWTLRRRLTVPLAHVRGATADPGMAAEPKGVRGPGTHVPGVVTAGTFRRDGETTFWSVKDAAKAVVIELSDEDYTRLVVEVDDPRATAELVAAALAS